MIGENKYCSDMMKIHFKKELVMTKEDSKNLKNSAKCWICENVFVDNDVRDNNDNNDKLREHCHVTGKYRGPGHTDCNII